MYSECTTVIIMPKKKHIASETKTISVRNFPVSLIQKLKELRRTKGINSYAFIRDAVHEKLEREKEH